MKKSKRGEEKDSIGSEPANRPSRSRDNAQPNSPHEKRGRRKPMRAKNGAAAKPEPGLLLAPGVEDGDVEQQLDQSEIEKCRPLQEDEADPSLPPDTRNRHRVRRFARAEEEEKSNESDNDSDSTQPGAVRVRGTQQASTTEEVSLAGLRSRTETPGIVEAELAPDIDQAIAQALQERDRQTVSAVQVTPDNDHWGRDPKIRKACIGLFALAVVAALAIAIPLVIIETPGNGSTAPTESPGTKPTSSSTRMQEMFDYIVSQGVSTRDDLLDPTSPQGLALDFLATQDGLALAAPETELDTEEGYQFITRYALVVFFHAMGGSSWDSDINFLSDAKTCDWFETFLTDEAMATKQGVSCGDDGRDILELFLSNINLNGTIPNELCHLTSMTSLTITFAAGIRGSVPPDIWRMTNLKALSLEYNSLTGPFPEILGTLTDLKSLVLSNNLFSGAIPESTLENLSDLTDLRLDDNLFDGSVSFIWGLLRLELANLEDNAFDGRIDSDIVATSPLLRILDLSGCELTGAIPKDLFRLRSLEVLDLHSNRLTGALPDDISNINDQLKFLALYDNLLSSTIPDAIGNNLIALEHLDVARNLLVLPYPESMNQMTNLVYLFTGGNNFADHRIPDFVFDLTRLRELSMKNNNLTGSIPGSIGRLTNLQLLDLDRNRLTGSIPSELALCVELDHLLLNRNRLSSTIPSSFATMTDLDVLLINQNSITGTAEPICGNEDFFLDFFASDCEGPVPEIECTCCEQCCQDSDPSCINFDWEVNLVPIWEFDYQRQVYNFGQDLLPP